jgi:hypothetical protein
LKLLRELVKTTPTSNVYSPEVVHIMDITLCSCNLRGSYEMLNLNGETLLSLVNDAFSFLFLQQSQTASSFLIECVLEELVESVFHAHSVLRTRLNSKMQDTYNLRGLFFKMSHSQLSNDDGNHNDDDYNVDDDAGCSRKSGPTIKYVKYEENIEAKDNVSTVVDGMYLKTVPYMELQYIYLH